MSEKILVLKGCAGLGNRIFSILNAISYCENTGRKLIVDWSDGQFGEKYNNIFNIFFFIDDDIYCDDLLNNFEHENDCFPPYWRGKLNCSIYDLYKVGVPKEYIVFFSKIFKFNKFKNRTKQLWIKKICKSKKYGFKEIFDTDNLTFGHLLSEKIDNKLLIYSDFIPQSINVNLLKKIKLQSSYYQELKYWTKKHELNLNFVGLHVRYTDKEPKKSLNDLISYVKTNYPKNPIFLSTDNSDVELKFKSIFDNVLCYEKKLPPPNTNRGIHMWGLDNFDEDYNERMLKDSIMDMWLLSKCEFLLYQGSSSFSSISKLLHSNPNKCYDWEE